MTILNTKILHIRIQKYGEENAIASLHKWFEDLFKHPEGYPVYFDKDNAEFENRSITTFPCLNIQQIDTQTLVKQFMGGKMEQSELLMYIYCNHSIKKGGSRRLIRRMRDQVLWAMKMAGICVKGTDADMYVSPVYFYDFSTTPITKTDRCITLKGGIQQRFIQEEGGDLIQQELMATYSYLEDPTA